MEDERVELLDDIFPFAGPIEGLHLGLAPSYVGSKTKFREDFNWLGSMIFLVNCQKGERNIIHREKMK